MAHYFQWLPDIIIYLILFFLYEMQRYCHYPITLASKLYTCCDLIAFLLIQNVYTSRAFSNHPLCSGNFPVWLQEKMAFEMALSLWCRGKKGMKENLRRWGPGLKHSFINTGWQKRSQVPDNEEGVAIFLKLSGDRENKNDIQLTNEWSLT